MGGHIQRSRAFIVASSSPVLLNGSTRNDAPSNSPTPSSCPCPSAIFPDFWVPPVICSVFPSTESCGLTAPPAAEISSGGGESSPTLGIWLMIVEVVFVRCGFRGFSCCRFRYVSVVSWPRSLRSLSGRADRENGRERGIERMARGTRRISRAEDIVCRTSNYGCDSILEGEEGQFSVVLV